MGVVYSTNPDFSFEQDDDDETASLSPARQKLYVSLDKKNRKGKAVTLVEGFVGTTEDLRELGKTLKSKCGVGGSVKDGTILIQGDFRDRISMILKESGYGVKRKGH